MSVKKRLQASDVGGQGRLGARRDLQEGARHKHAVALGRHTLSRERQHLLIGCVDPLDAIVLDGADTIDQKRHQNDRGQHHEARANAQRRLGGCDRWSSVGGLV
jgi:hypothetical protein